MCGRIVQFQGMTAYVEELSPQLPLLSSFDGVPFERYNVAPSTRVQILHGTPDGILIDAVKWGWSPFWAKGRRPDPINARVETVATGKFFKPLWPHGRALVPSEGWYEWIRDPSDPKRKQPYFIRLKSQQPMFFGALAQVQTGVSDDRDGFVIITAASDEGMVDIHDRRPLVLKPEHAREWIEPGLSAGQAEELARECCRPTDDFEWYTVGKAVGNVRNQGPDLILPSGFQ